MKILSIIIIIVIMLLLPLFVHVAKITLEVVDEQGKPVKDAVLGYDKNSPLTDKYGKISILVNTSDGVVGGGIGKDGYYDSIFHHDFVAKKYIFWRPWNKHYKVVIRPIVNPVPMYVRNKWYLNVPVLNEDVGYDLSKADWVLPYGNGERSDFIFKVERQYKDYTNFDATLTISFSNQYDGIQVIKDNRGGDYSVGSNFRLLRNAPENGYQPKLVKRFAMGVFGLREPNDDNDNYIFRIRSEINNGKLKRAMYGKILGDILFDVRDSEVATIRMHYYLNPDYTRNLEFDPKRNLFTNLPPTEGVALP